MIDYSKWQRRDRKVSGLLLDPENPRIPQMGRQLPQNELIAELIRYEKVYDLAKRIVAKGYFADESLIAAPSGSKLIVVEGNRRLAALKLLLSPEAAPEREQKNFGRLSRQIVHSMINSVPVTIAPSREAALPRIAEKHTREATAKWSTAQQARFYQSLLKPGVSRADVCEQFNMTEGKLQDQLEVAAMYRMARLLELPQEISEKVQDPRMFNVTVLERLVQSKLGREFLGLERDPDSIFRGVVPYAEFQKAFGKVVTDTVNGDLTTRVINDGKATVKYLARIKHFAPSCAEKGRFKATDVIETAPVPAPSAPPAKGKPRVRAKTKLLPSGITCGVSGPRINDVFNELKNINAVNYPNAAALLLRVLLDIGMEGFLDRLGKTDAVRQRWTKPGQKRPADWYPSCRQQLLFILDEGLVPLTPLQLKAVKRFADKESKTAALDTLDQFAHNKQMKPTMADLDATITKIEPLLRAILSPAQQPKP